jgi:hypothetical protein
MLSDSGFPDPSQTYLAIHSILRLLPFLLLPALCFRNVLGSNSVSGKDVWLRLGIGLACCIGSFLFGYRVVLGQSPDVSLEFVLRSGLFFFFLIYGMVMAIIKRQLNLEPLQWAMNMVIALLGIVFCDVISSAGKMLPVLA